MWWGDPHRIPWLTQESTNQVALAEEAMWRPCIHSHLYIKTKIERERERAILLRLFSLFILRMKLLCNFLVSSVTTPHGQTDWRRRWRPANRGGAALFSGDSPPKTQTFKQEPHFILAGDSKSSLVFFKLPLKRPNRYQKKKKNLNPNL